LEQNSDFLEDSTDLYCSFISDSRRSSRAGKVPLPGVTSTAIASSGGAGGMSSSSGQGQDASSSSSVTAAGTASANGIPVPASIPSVPGDEHAVHHANVASGRNTILCKMLALNIFSSTVIISFEELVLRADFCNSLIPKALFIFFWNSLRNFSVDKPW